MRQEIRYPYDARSASRADIRVDHRRWRKHMAAMRAAIKALSADDYAGLTDADVALSALQRVVDEVDGWMTLSEDR